MRGARLAGALLVAFGIVVLALGLRSAHARKILDVGDGNATVTEHARVPNWVGAVSIVGGVLMIGAAGNRRRYS